MEILPTGAVTEITNGVRSVITDNIAVVLGMLAFIVGLSIVMALIDIQLNERRNNAFLDNYRKRRGL